MSRKPNRKKMPVRKRRRKPGGEAHRRTEQRELERRKARFSEASIFLHPFGPAVYVADSS